MRVLNEIETQLVSGGYESIEWPSAATEEYYTNFSDGFFDSYSFDLKNRVVMGNKAVTTVNSKEEAIKAVEECGGSFVIKYKAADGEKPEIWTIECKVPIVRK
ncbi:hypothetical protein [Pseudoduganella violacea]|uniref:Uncharacterized protein n=1 Tax=Pseudoduganella violacea TaxID=1715466 RepID=A0A7W5BDU7_9BURK|nr:hypothetical protein [Pseudoduganella violacea]MBB3121075.1 hypothetical protein [Pseudoduganella violacea]